MGIETAIIGGAAIGGLSSIIGGNQAASATDRASRRATDATMQMYTQNRADLTPYREAGYAALDPIKALFLGSPAEQNAAMSNFRTSPQYEFVRNEGLRGLENTGSARGGQLSGNALRGATQFTTGLASGEFNSYVDRLFGIAGLGSNATSQGVSNASHTGDTLAQIYTNQGNARASIYGNTAAGVNDAVQGGLQNWAFNNYLNRNPANIAGAERLI